MVFITALLKQLSRCWLAEVKPSQKKRKGLMLVQLPFPRRGNYLD